MIFFSSEERQQAAEDLRASAEAVERNGWFQGDYYEKTEGKRPEECKVCAIGAIRLATTGRVMRSSGRTVNAVEAVGAFLNNRIVHYWNDRQGQTAEAVVKAMRDCADALEASA